MNRNHALILVGLALGLSVAAAQTDVASNAPAAAAAPVAAPNSHWVVTPSVVSQYMFRGVRLGGPAFQPSIEFDSGNAALGIWASIPIVDKVPGQSDPEIDPYGSYTFSISDAFSIQPGFSLYTYPRAKESDGFYKWTFEPNVAFNCTVAGTTLTPKFYYDLVAKGPTYELTVTCALPLAALGTELDFTGTLGTFIWRDAYNNSNPRAKNWGNYGLLGVAMPYQISKSAKFSVGIAYAKGTGNFVKIGDTPKFEYTSAVGRLVVTLSCAVTY